LNIFSQLAKFSQIRKGFSPEDSVFGQFYDVAKVAMIHRKLQAKCESKIVKHLSIFLATHLNHVNRKIRQFFLNFGQILTIEILEKHLTLALLFFNITFGLNKASKKNKG